MNCCCKCILKGFVFIFGLSLLVMNTYYHFWGEIQWNNGIAVAGGLAMIIGIFA